VKPRYIVDSKGRKAAVVLSMMDYRALLEDLHDLGVMAERRDEPTVPWEEVKARLRGGGLT
jgi:hypothetical protein